MSLAFLTRISVLAARRMRDRERRAKLHVLRERATALWLELAGLCEDEAGARRREERRPMTSNVTFFTVHNVKDERLRCTRHGALALLEAEVVILEDEARGYREVIKGREALEAVIDSGESRLRVLHVVVDSTTDDVERMLAALQVVTEKNPTGQPPYVLPDDEEAP